MREKSCSPLLADYFLVFFASCPTACAGFFRFEAAAFVSACFFAPPATALFALTAAAVLADFPELAGPAFSRVFKAAADLAGALPADLLWICFVDFRSAAFAGACEGDPFVGQAALPKDGFTGNVAWVSFILWPALSLAFLFKTVQLAQGRRSGFRSSLRYFARLRPFWRYSMRRSGSRFFGVGCKADRDEEFLREIGRQRAGIREHHEGG